MPQMFKIQAAAKVEKDHNFYRRAGLVLTGDQKEFEVDIDQLAILRADKRVVVVGGPVDLPKREMEKTADPKELRLQQLAESRDQLEVRARQAEAENEQLKAQISAAKQKADKGGKSEK